MAEMTAQTPVIIFGDDISAYGVIRALGPKKIPIYIISRTGKGMSIHSKYVKKVLTIDPYDDIFFQKLNEWCDKEIGTEAVLIVAGDDEYLDILSQNYDSLVPKFKPTFPPWEIVKKVRNKRETYEIAERIGVPVPKTVYITSDRELSDMISNGLRFPLLMKTEESKRFYNKYRIKGIVIQNEKELFENYIKYEYFYGKLLLQEMIPGGEEMLFCLKTVLNKDSEPLSVFVDKKIRSSAQFLSCTLTTSTWSNEVVEYGLRLLKYIGYIGYASVEFKLDVRNHTFKLMEINGRVSKNNSNALAAGINLPYQIYQEAILGPLPCVSDINQKYADKIVWWQIDGEVGFIYRSIKNKNFNLIEYLKPLMSRSLIIEPLNIWDLKPFVCSIKQDFKIFIGKIKR